MTGRLYSSLINDLRAAGLRVVVIDGWLNRGRPGAFDPVGSLNHHTGASARGWTLVKELAYAKWMFLVGRPDLPAPLCQIALGRSGTVYVGAAGRANHAGTARAAGSVAAGDGNTLYVGSEWMLSGTEEIPEEMYEAGVTLNAVLCRKQTGNSPETVACHYSTSVTGKWDIGDPNGVRFGGARVLDLNKFRRLVAEKINALYGGSSKPEPGPDEIANILCHFPLARLGGEKGQALWDLCEASVRKQANRSIRRGVSTTFTLDTNLRGRLPNLGPGLRRIGGRDIDLIAFRKAVGGASIKVLKRKMVNLHIDGHECWGVRLKVTFPSGKVAKFWLVSANLGRGADDEKFRRHVKRIRRAFGRYAVYNFMEIDEADEARENKILHEVFTNADFVSVNEGRMVQTLVGRRAKVKITDTDIRIASPGAAKISPTRQVVTTTLGPK